MKWGQDYESSDVDDRRGASSGSGGGGGGGLGLLFGLIFRFGWKGGLVIFGLLAIGQHFLMPMMRQQQPQTVQKAGPDAARSFVGFVLDDVQKTWTQKFADAGKQYEHARVVLYSNGMATGCGYGSAAMGPFYCPKDEHVYLDVSFFDELSQRFGAKGDFAKAYVIAHELGHHVQHQLGLMTDVDHASASALNGAGHLSVRMELQADCLAGVWAKSTDQRHLLEPGDLESALTAAAAICDDKLQTQATGHVQPETWTHGSSAERSRWFKAGYDGGTVASCDTSHGSLDN